MATLPDHLGPFLIDCEHCGQPFSLTIPVTMRALDKGMTVEVNVSDEAQKSVSRAFKAHLRQHVTQ